MNWISVAELAIIHDRVIGETGGVAGITNQAGLESVLVRPFAGFADVELYPDLLSKVAALIHGVAAFHPFADGNKRTALVAGDVCLRLNGLRLVPGDELEPFFWRVARGEVEVAEIADWLAAHTESWGEEIDGN